MLTGHTRRGTEWYGLIWISDVSRAVAGGAVFVYLRAVFKQPDYVQARPFSSLKKFSSSLASNCMASH